MVLPPYSVPSLQFAKLHPGLHRDASVVATVLAEGRWDVYRWIGEQIDQSIIRSFGR